MRYYVNYQVSRILFFRKGRKDERKTVTGSMSRRIPAVAASNSDPRGA